MSWRLLFFTLLVLAGIATVGGLYAGDWLIDHAPKQANLPNIDENDPTPKVDANGIPILNQPPQPLMSGKMGVAESLPTVDWQVKSSNLMNGKTVTSSGSSLSNSAPLKSTENVINAGAVSQNITTRPISNNNTSNNNAGFAWEGAFRKEMATCRQLGFSERPSCISTVRAKYCGANNAWGKISDCPAR
ncbi:hypothetical protein V757_07100 [Pelistega indica]|uniref:Uncharacterized protein n=1 Tax=Pelistega indica TaxID=1414851 RepID=V8G2S5_9BURK|nr:MULTISPECIES: hypothetical protein [Pelistega]ETD70740.1 hypothetical protein V757_07100 [Pelistega indica]